MNYREISLREVGQRAAAAVLRLSRARVYVDALTLDEAHALLRAAEASDFLYRTIKEAMERDRQEPSRCRLIAKSARSSGSAP
jgi:hypothetical protein